MSKGKEELLNTLVKDYGYDQEQLENLEEEQLKIMLNCEAPIDDTINEDDLEQVFGTAEIVEPDDERCSKQDLSQPEYTSPLWGEYVLNQFTNDELFDGNPTVDGLRRVTEMLLGDILESSTQIVQTPTPDNGERATAIARVVINVLYADGHSVTKAYSGAADAYPGNLQAGFEKYPVALAETRAEARALRKALRLRTVSHEELGNGEAVNVNKREKTQPITQAQITTINYMAKGMKINVEKLLESLDKAGTIVYNGTKNLSDSDGLQICKALSAYNADHSLIPQELTIGFSEDWRK